MKRILVIGSCGAGKSIFSRALHEITNLPLIHLDRHYWKPGWVEPNKDDWENTVLELISGKEWIIDGNYGGTMDIRIGRADTVIWLDLSRSTCLFRVLKRVVLFKRDGRPDMADGCDERIDWSFLKYVWKFKRDKNPKLEERLQHPKARFETYRLSNSASAKQFLDNLKNGLVLRSG